MKILLVTTRYPWPSWRGDQMRGAEFSRLLSGRHEVTLLTPVPPPGSPPPPDNITVETYGVSRWGAVIGGLKALPSGLPLQSALQHQADLRRKILYLAPKHDLVVLQLVRLVEYALLLASLPLQREGIPYAVDFIDSLALNFERRARFDHPLLRPLWRSESRRLAKAERRMMDRSALSMFVCERDRFWSRGAVGSEPQGSSGSRQEVIRLAIEPARGRVSGASKPSVVMTGNLGYFVNRDAATWFLDGVWSRFAKERPDVHLVVAGHRPPTRLMERCQRLGVELVPSPEDLREIVRNGSISVAPMRAGSGVPVKILEAWAESKPVIASPWAAAGTDGQAGVHLAVADGPEEWVEVLHRVLGSKDEQVALGREGAALVRDLHTNQAVRQTLLDAFEQI